jgi:hypothetical protein
VYGLYDDSEPRDRVSRPVAERRDESSSIIIRTIVGIFNKIKEFFKYIFYSDSEAKENKEEREYELPREIANLMSFLPDIDNVGRQRQIAPPAPEEKKVEEVKIYKDDDKKCSICMNNEKSIILIPCGHLYTCRECIKNIKEKQDLICPICRGQIERYVDISSIK